MICLAASPAEFAAAGFDCHLCFPLDSVNLFVNLYFVRKCPTIKTTHLSEQRSIQELPKGRKSKSEIRNFDKPNNIEFRESSGRAAANDRTL